ncbi:MAG: DNA polymerase/3'-5' exonuclease PolX [Candidatus Omnitrophota bacterium]
MKNFEIANIFNVMADILELNDENPFRIRAYRKAALNLEALTEDLEDIAQKNKVKDIPGIGSDLASKIAEYLSTGRIEAYEKLKKETPQILLEMTAIPGVGTKTSRLLYNRLKIKSIADLEAKAKAHKIQALPGMKAKTEENILKGIALIKRSYERMPFAAAEAVADGIITKLRALPEVKNISAAGSLRRKKETIGDIDILVASDRPEGIMNIFTGLPQVKKVLSHGETRSSILTYKDVQADLRVVKDDSFGAALCYFTGSKSHNIQLRKIAIKKKLKLNEYGLFSGKKRVAGKDEAGVYRKLGMAFIPPELREDQGEIQSAINNKLPNLLKLGDIKGDFHAHSNWSDGKATLEELAAAAKKLGYEYLAVTDHSKSLRIAGGLKENELLEKIGRIKNINKKLKGIRLLAGAEVDIANDGRLDYADDILKQLDIVIAAIHSGFKQTKEKLTRRITTAMKNKHVHIIAHLSGRLLGARDPYEIDTDDILKAAGDTNTALEVNAFPDRLDLTDINCRRAKNMGVKMAIGTDAHALEHLNANMQYGINVARRGWLKKKDVLNTLSLDALLKALKK